MPILKDQVCIVTGGASGLGREIVNQLLAEEATVAVIDLDEKALESFNNGNGADHPGCGGRRHASPLTYRCDVTNESQVEETIAKISSDLGKITVLVNNVGILFSSPLVSIGAGGVVKHDSAMWDKVIATNLSAAFYTSKHVVEAMLKKRSKGVIVNISSVSAKGNAGQSAYSAAKAGIEALTKVWAKELAPMGIRSFAVAPGFCDTPSTHGALNEKVLQETVTRVPLRRLGRAEEIAAFVVSGIKNDYLNGKILEIDGGLVI